MAAVSPADRVPGMVSVIMPFLDPPESFFRDAIQSIEDQAYDNWELILVDDGSAAAISRVAIDIAEHGSGKILYIEHDGHRNLGISASRNRGIGVTRGEYVAFLDADDLWDSNQLEDQVPLLEQHPDAAMLYGNTLYWRSWEGDKESEAVDVLYDLGAPMDRVIEPPNLLRLVLTRRATPPCMTTILVRRQLFDAGFDFEESFPVHYEDQVFFAKIASQLPVYVSSRSWGKYRQHNASVTGGAHDTDEALAWRQKYLRWMAGYLENSGVDDRRLRFLVWLETGMLENPLINLAARFYRLWRGRFRRLLAPLGSH